jgi:hypothetical protein
VTNREAQVEKLQNRVKVLRGRRTDIVHSLNPQADPMDPDLPTRNPYPGGEEELRKIEKELKDLEPQLKELEGELLALKEATEADMAIINTRVPKGGGAYRGFAKLEVMLGIVATVAAAYLLARDIRYILDADNAMEGLERAVEVSGDFAAGAAEMGILKIITGSNAAAAGLILILGMCGDSAGACEAQERAEQQKAEEKQRREQKRQLNKAIGDFLAKNVPGSVEWVEDTYMIRNQKVWDETVKRVQELHQEHEAKRKAILYKRARDLGSHDGKVTGKFDTGVKDRMKDWKDVREDDIEEFMLFDAYKDGFKEGNKKWAAAVAKARNLGYQDGVTGTKAHIDDIAKWPEVAQLVKDGAVEPILWQDLYGNYNDAFDIKTGKKSPYEGLDD